MMPPYESSSSGVSPVFPQTRAITILIVWSLTIERFDCGLKSLNLLYDVFAIPFSLLTSTRMQLGRSELIKTLEASAFALTLILLALAQSPAAPNNLGFLLDTVSVSSSR